MPLQGAACLLSQAELDSLLSCIKDLLPDLGDGFLLACLQEYDYNSELVINNILEDRLAPNLDKLDRAMPRQDPTLEHPFFFLKDLKYCLFSELMNFFCLEKQMQMIDIHNLELVVFYACCSFVLPGQ